MSAQTVLKCLPVMPVSVKDMLRILRSNFMGNNRSHKVT